MNPNTSRNRFMHFLLTQLTHTTLTTIVLVLLFTGATQVDAFAQVFNTRAASTGSSFTIINYQGRLTNASGNPINGTYQMAFALYDVNTGGSALWSETHANILISDGLFSVGLGSLNALNTDLLNGDRWLEIQVGTDAPMTPREMLSAVPFAIHAASANYALQAQNATHASHADKAATVADGVIGATQLANGAVTQEKAPSLLLAPGNDQRMETGSLTLQVQPGWQPNISQTSFDSSFLSKLLHEAI